MILLGLDRNAEALVHYQSVLAQTLTVHGANSVEAGKAMISVGMAYVASRDGAAAETILRSAIVLLDRLNLGDSWDSSDALLYLGTTRMDQGLTEEALGLFERCLAIRRKTLPPGHPSFANLLRCISVANEMLGRAPAAAEAHKAARTIERRSQSACAGPGCTRMMREDGAPLDVCVKCRCTFYCGKACQTADWKAGHRKECKALITAAAGTQH